MAYKIVLLGFDSKDTEFAELLQKVDRVQEMIDCGTDFQRARQLLNGDLFAVFAISTMIPTAQIIAFAESLIPVWRRGIIVGQRNDDLALQTFQTYRVADYISPPMDETRLERAFGHLQYWKSMWLGEQPDNGSERRRTTHVPFKKRH